MDERFRKLLREFQSQPKTAATVGRIYLEYLRAGLNPAELIEERIQEVTRSNKNPAIWLQVCRVFRISPEVALTVQCLMRRKNRAKILGIEIKGMTLYQVDGLAMERIAQLVGGEVAVPDNPTSSTYETCFIQRSDIDGDDITILYHGGKFSLDPPTQTEICDNCANNDHRDCELGLDEDGDCQCCGEPAICESCSFDTHAGCENGLETIDPTNQIMVCNCCGEEVEVEDVEDEED